ARAASQFGRVLPHRERVHVDDAVEAVEAFLQLHPVPDGAEIVAEMQVAGRLDAGKDAVHGVRPSILGRGGWKPGERGAPYRKRRVGRSRSRRSGSSRWIGQRGWPKERPTAAAASRSGLFRKM